MMKRSASRRGGSILSNEVWQANESVTFTADGSLVISKAR
jgi:hypothetical protein